MTFLVFLFHRMGMISQFFMFMVTLYFFNGHDMVKCYIILLQFYLKHIHKAKFYPSNIDFTQVLLVMLVKKIISDSRLQVDH